MENNKKPSAEDKSPEQKGKEAIDAAIISDGKDPNDEKVKADEKKDAEKWRNEG